MLQRRHEAEYGHNLRVVRPGLNLHLISGNSGTLLNWKPQLPYIKNNNNKDGIHFTVVWVRIK